jgi:uncharacterized membrane protein
VRPLLRYFLRGLVLFAPIAITGWVLVRAFTLIDGWLDLPWPGAGFAATLLIILLVGFLASNLITSQLIQWAEEQLERVPFVRLVYTSTKDLLNAFVGEQRRFNRPALVTLAPGGARALCFITQESLDSLELPGHVAVYVPQAYAFAGITLVVEKSAVEPIQAEPADVMAFVVSAGVTALEGKRVARG